MGKQHHPRTRMQNPPEMGCAQARLSPPVPKPAPQGSPRAGAPEKEAVQTSVGTGMVTEGWGSGTGPPLLNVGQGGGPSCNVHRGLAQPRSPAEEHPRGRRCPG